MPISDKYLREYGADEQSYGAEEILFEQGEKARYYFQIHHGRVKMCNVNDDGKEFIQQIFGAGESFGEPPLFGDFDYPASAVALENSVVWRLPKAGFLQLLEKHPQIHFKVSRALAERLHYKAMMAQEMGLEKAGHRIQKLLHYVKTEVQEIPADQPCQIQLKRQQIADLTGLSVETAIRAIKKLEEENALKIARGKIWI